jgi:hypothetical protein
MGEAKSVRLTEIVREEFDLVSHSVRRDGSGTRHGI